MGPRKLGPVEDADQDQADHVDDPAAVPPVEPPPPAPDASAAAAALARRKAAAEAARAQSRALTVADFADLERAVREDVRREVAELRKPAPVSAQASGSASAGPGRYLLPVIAAGLVVGAVVVAWFRMRKAAP